MSHRNTWCAAPGCVFIGKTIADLETHVELAHGAHVIREIDRALEGRPDYDDVRRPAHYVEGRTIEPIDAIIDWKLDFLLGQVVKYVSRAGRKPTASMRWDLEKAAEYLRRKIEALPEDDAEGESK